MGACTMGMLKAFPIVLLLGVSAMAQSPTYGVGRTPSAEEIRAWDISIGPTGAELPPGRGTAKDGAQIYVQKGCAACHDRALLALEETDRQRASTPSRLSLRTFQPWCPPKEMEGTIA